ncbi:uncharacterized protein LOC103713724 [Phoenix dactylifera]|uniref:Uncharacterized protein LOC103713724 n=1 Tax=Phoenix dactylifera TaxID=42345 RepID=A0A8B7CH20_PHODC|nr:uncharacterized protein LOC103713724 [Phoenix dactylifera]
MSRPARSDAYLPPEEAAKIEAEAREYFQGFAPKRHSKPSRSEYSSVYSDAFHPSDQDFIPEIDKLRDLQADPQRLVCDGGGAVEEYVETEYYTEMNCIDKKHHTTGTGFIKMEKSNGSSIDLTPVSPASGGNMPYKGNPATNEWIPSADMVVPISSKPNRSDN